ncbi:kelch-like protein 10 [Gouania willdenowi]|uniref:Kelch-like protein 10 n=1 Tax=Gouania willdenowi TaxID=441366 RepID=A0A8C5FXX9_GOUWI|nr:kelch-like protein 10 [Gouania willdenowi]
MANVKRVNFMMSGSTPNELRLKGRLCDAVIIVGDVQFLVHKLILCSCSIYFSNLFLDGSNKERRVFVIDDVSPEIMEQIIDFAYTSSFTLNNDNVFDLIIAANHYSITSLADICSQYLEDRLCPENCVRVWQVTNTIDSPVLQKRVFGFICDHFEEVMELEEFLQLEVDDLADILGCDGLNIQQESTAFESILKWIAHKPDERQDKITTLLSKVRLGLLSLTFLQLTVLTNDVVTTNADSNLMVHNAIKDMSELEEDAPPGSYLEIALPRLPNVILLATGGWTGNTPANTIESYDFSTNCWFRGPLCTLKHSVAQHGTAFLNGDLYIVGGENSTHYLSSVYKFPYLTNTWEEVAPMHQQRCYVSVAVLNERIYAMGGYDGIDQLSTAEVYQPETNQWTFIAPMNNSRSKSSCTTLRNKIYICGGFTDGHSQVTAERYDPSTNQWTLIASMSTGRCRLSVVAYMEHIFAVGGFNGNRFLSSAEAYNPVTNTWWDVCKMLTPRSNFGIAVINKRLFVVGGRNRTISNRVECYDATTDSWSRVCKLKTPRYGLSCCLLSGLPHMEKYSGPRHILPSHGNEE